MDGVLITFEGLEGSGKSTQAKLLFQSLYEKNFPCVLTSEPGGTPLGEAIRDIFISQEFKDMTPLSELLLVSSSRAQHVEKLIRPSLEEGKIVICDRFTDASLAYQGFGRGLPLNIVREMNSRAAWNVQPDITIYLDIEPSRGLQRIYRRIQELEVPADRIEKEGIEFFQRVREGYLTVSRDEPVRFRVLDAGLEVQVLQKQIYDLVNKELSKRKFKKNLLFGP